MTKRSLAHWIAFLSAALLFALQLLTAREYLAFWGGSFAVWGAVSVAFQLVLIASYASTNWLVQRGVLLHVLAAALPIAWLRLLPMDAATPLWWLVVRVLPLGFVLGLSAVTWEAQLQEDPQQRVYAWSNRGSFVGLLLYAVAIEPWTDLPTQNLGYASLYTFLVWQWWRGKPGAKTNSRQAHPESPTQPIGLRIAFVGAALASALSLATTQLLALDVGNFPLIWAAPLALFLSAYVVAFSQTRVLVRLSEWLFAPALGLGLLFFFGAANLHTYLQLVVECVVLWVVATATLVRVAAQRERAAASMFFSAIAWGGAIGGAFVGLVFPLVFDRLLEYPLLLVGAGGFATWIPASGAGHDPGSPSSPARSRTRPIWQTHLVFAATLFLGTMMLQRAHQNVEIVARARSPYGVYRVTERPSAEGRVRELIFGTTQHGRALLDNPGEPQSYFHRNGPLADIDALLAGPRRVAVVGLGVGAISAYARANDTWVYFELDAQIDALARREFEFLGRASGSVTTRIGDARLLLAQDSVQYDWLLIDAFSGDSIPLHLLTVEALAVYRARTLEDGVIAFHLSNRYYALAPFVAAAGRAIARDAYAIRKVEGLAVGEDPSEYLVLLPHEASGQAQSLIAAGFHPLEPAARAFTDARAEWPRCLRFGPRVGTRW